MEGVRAGLGVQPSGPPVVAFQDCEVGLDLEQVRHDGAAEVAVAALDAAQDTGGPPAGSGGDSYDAGSCGPSARS